MISGAFALAMVLAADSAPTDASNGPVVVVLVAGVAAVGTIATALGPTFVEIVKNRGSRNKPPAPATPPATPPATTPTPAPTPAEGAPANSNGPSPTVTTSTQNAFNGLTMVEQAVLDSRQQRDEAMRRYFEIAEDLEEAREIIREQAVRIARLEAAGTPQRNTRSQGRHGMGPSYYDEDRR